MNLRTSIINRIKKIFSDLNEKTTFTSRYWNDTVFLLNSKQSAIPIIKLESYFDGVAEELSDDDLLDLYEFVTIESELFDFNGFN